MADSTDSIENFESLLRNQGTKRLFSIYGNDKQEKSSVQKSICSYTARDVISSVALTLKALQNADSVKSDKNVRRKLEKYKKSTFLPVSLLPVHNEEPRASTSSANKFETQSVSDTQLIDMITNAEAVIDIDSHQGITQEFETTFSEKLSYIKRTVNQDEKHSPFMMESDLNATQIDCDGRINMNLDKHKNYNPENNDSDLHIGSQLSIQAEVVNKNNCLVPQDILKESLILDTKEHSTNEEYIKIIKGREVSSQYTSPNIDNGFEEKDVSLTSTQIFNTTNLEIEAKTLNFTEEAERPTSPVFTVPTKKAKTSQHLVYDLDAFEKFEKIAAFILSSYEVVHLTTAKHLIDSQILGKELLIQPEAEIQFLDDVNDTPGSPILPRQQRTRRTQNEEHLSLKINCSSATKQNINLKTSDSARNCSTPFSIASEILKDELLFSSDEEDDYIHKNIQDLPFTCALETSFYANQSDILDKTMFVGFQTASNKSIQICTDSFDMAKSVFEDVDKIKSNDVPTSLTELVAQCDNVISEKNINKEPVMGRSSQLVVENIGFRTASGKIINVSDEAVCKTKNVFKDLESDIQTITSWDIKDDKSIEAVTGEENTNLQGFKTASHRNSNLSEKCLTRAKKLFRDIDLDDNFHEPSGTESKEHEIRQTSPKNIALPETSIKFEGFKTASNKNIIISSKALEDSHKMFKDIDDASNILDEGSNNVFQNIKVNELFELKTTNNQDNLISAYETKCRDVSNKKDTDINNQNLNENLDNEDELLLEEFNTEIEFVSEIKEKVTSTETCDKQSIVGFKTASKKQINVSKQSLVKTKAIFQDIDSVDYTENINTTDMHDRGNTKQTNSGGLESASNKNIQISKETFSKTKNIFQDIDNVPGSDISDIKSSSENLFKIARPLENKQIFQHIERDPVFKGFQTASNKPVKVSKESLAKTKNIFEDIDLIPSTLDSKIFETEIVFTGLKTASDNKHSISEKFLARTKNIFQDIDVENTSIESICSNKNADFIGFQTASNKKVSISEKALKTSKKIFENIDKDINITEKLGTSNKSESPSLRCLQTASNRKVNVSEGVLAKTRTIFKDVNHEELSPSQDSNIGFDGFQTASKKEVKLSKEALAKTRKIFQGIEINEECPIQSDTTMGFVNFQTTGNKKVTVSEDALAKSKNIFNDVDIANIKPIETTGFIGFQTASKKKVAISEEALAKTTKIFQDLNVDDPLAIDTPKGFVGFQTASNKKVAISEEASAKTKSIFQEIGLSQNVNPQIDAPIAKTSAFAGFQTASKKKVAISEEALTKTRKIFQDINVDDPLAIDTPKGFVGFQTASNKKVAISEEASAKTKSIFQEIGLSQNVNPQIDTPIAKTFAFAGFQTASKKNVAISEEALVKTRKIFQDINEDDPVTVGTPKGFVGFQTASNKHVAISEEALTKTKSIFQEIDLSQNVNPQIDTPIAKPSAFAGFQTASKKKVEITEESLAKTRNIFKDIDDKQNDAKVNPSLMKSRKLDTYLKETGNTSNNDKNIDKQLINTQVLNNFEETLNTEDFCKSPKTRKRPGSPILFCPKAKKRKCFKTPYKLKLSDEAPKSVTKIPNKPESILVFNDNYKQKKILTLKDIDLLEKSSKSHANIDPYIQHFKFEDLLSFEFSGTRNNVTNKNLSTEDVNLYFLESVNKKIVPNGWVDNHLKLILWKLISYEMRFPKSMENACNAKNVMDQLKYRYDRELYNVERPALRKIFEKDDTSARTMVLCVVSILVDGISVTSVTNPTAVELLLTDGWYCITACADRMLTRLVCDGKIVVGCKLVVCGAEIVGCEQGVAPWEDTSAVRLKISGNSTRLARWDARLGRHGNAAILVPWATVRADGGKVSKSRVLVTRVYPPLYVHKYEDGNTVTRSERLEQIYQVKYEAERQIALEKLYEEVEKEVADQDSQDTDPLSQGGSNKRRCMESGSQIAKMMKRSKDPQEFRSHLSESQTHLLTEHSSKQREWLLQDIEMRMQAKLEKSGLNQTRNVVSLLKIRVAGVRERDGMMDVCKGLLSIWRPSDAILEILQEGAWVDVMNVVPTAQRNSELQVSAGRQSTFDQAKVKETDKLKALTKCFLRTCTNIKDIVQNPSLNTDYNEIDTVGIIFLIEPTNKDLESVKNQHFQNVFLADADKNIICVNFWGGINKFGFENILDTGQLVACINLQKRIGNSRKNIPQYRVTEFTYFTKTPKHVSSRNSIQELVKKFNGIDRRKFCQDCVELKNNFSVLKHQNNNENVSPYRFNETDYNISRNKLFIDSPLIQKAVANKKELEDLSLTGLDFESTFKQKETQVFSPEELKRKKRVNEKIAKLKMYGEPPPLTTIHIINKSKDASKSYKSPLISKNLPQESPKTTKTSHDSDGVASLSNQNLPNETPKTLQSAKSTSDDFVSPVVSMNRTYVKKSVNPIKLNFSKNQNEESIISVGEDHFAEEFDSSPPLSLD